MSWVRKNLRIGDWKLTETTSVNLYDQVRQYFNELKEQCSDERIFLMVYESEVIKKEHEINKVSYKIMETVYILKLPDYDEDDYYAGNYMFMDFYLTPDKQGEIATKVTV